MSCPRKASAVLLLFHFPGNTENRSKGRYIKQPEFPPPLTASLSVVLLYLFRKCGTKPERNCVARTLEARGRAELKTNPLG